MAVHGFAGRVLQEAGVGIFDVEYFSGTEALDGGGGEAVFLIEIGGDDEVAAGFELGEGLVEDAGPDFGVVPVVLVAQKSDVGVFAEFGDFTELVATMGEESGADFFADILPTTAGGVDLGGADVEALQVGGGGFFAENSGEDGGFVGAAAGEIEEIEVIFFGDERGEMMAQRFF